MEEANITGDLSLELGKAAAGFVGEKILESLEGRVTLTTPFSKDLIKLKRDLLELSSYVSDPSSKHDEQWDSLRLWSVDLYHSAMGAEDVLHLFQAHEHDPSFSFSRFHVRFHLQMAERIRDIQSSVNELFARADMLRLTKEFGNYNHLKQTVSQNLTSETCCVSNREERKSVGVDSKVCHIRRLLKENRAVSVVGKGGMGKTYLLQHVLKVLRSEYEVAIWLSVAHNYTIHSLQVDMLSQLKYSTPKEDVQSDDKTRQDIILELLGEKSCLLVLDDVWDVREEERQEFTTVFHKLKRVGLPEHDKCNMLISTRDESVANCFNAEIYKPELLNDEEGMELLCHHGSSLFLEDKALVKRVLSECGGFPLAILVLGGVLSYQDKEEWHTTLEKLDAFPSNNSSASLHIMRILALGFRMLSHKLKRCFASLCFFSSYIFILDMEVIGVWQAQGLVDSMEDGKAVIEELVNRSLLQEIDRLYGRVVNYHTLGMHDMIRDLASSISSEIGDLCCDTADKQQWNNARCVNLSACQIESISNYVYCGATVSTLNLSFNKQLKMIPPHFLENARAVRVLDLANTSISKLPNESLSSLKFLKYLVISKTTIDVMPECIRSLKFLEFLFLPEKIVHLPEWLGELSRLQVVWHNGLNSFIESQNARWLTKLQCLRVLKGYILEVHKDGLRLDDLSILPLEQLDIEGDFNNEEGGPPPSLDSLYASNSEDEIWEMTDSWKSIANIDILSIVNIGLPKWVDMFQRLRVLGLVGGSIEGCNVKYISLLPRLRRLCLGFNDSCESLPDEFGRRHSFPMLNDLEIQGLTKLEEMPEMEDGAMPCLKCLFIKDCPGLQCMSSGLGGVVSRLDLLGVQRCEEGFTHKIISWNVRAWLTWNANPSSAKY